ncbi:hypothetical protein ARMSODRAFT_605449 [Armillaria solidipes]|uniref:Uncharacterized protein n=1 Tax=Armillaria solidipes TaxID=1076256 RepID=A0A2H3B8R6_9AGAR|nr:hypothetical protein ARMSODRAFT_605449 [Armillaria solidipes]
MIAAAYVGTAMPVLTDSQIKDIFIHLDTQFNQVMIHAFTHGIYTGVVAVTLWAVASRKSPQNNRRRYFLELTILLLYLLGTFSLCYEWITNASIFITNGKNLWTVYESSISLTPSPILVLTAGIDATLSTILADVTLIWRCWTIWGRSWRVVLVPILCTAMATVSRGIVTYYSTFGPIDNVPPQALYLEKIVNWAVLYSSLILATLLCCTILIIYRILRLGGISAGMCVYHRVVECSKFVMRVLELTLRSLQLR